MHCVRHILALVGPGHPRPQTEERMQGLPRKLGPPRPVRGACCPYYQQKGQEEVVSAMIGITSSCLWRFVVLFRMHCLPAASGVPAAAAPDCFAASVPRARKKKESCSCCCCCCCCCRRCCSSSRLFRLLPTDDAAAVVAAAAASSPSSMLLLLLLNAAEDAAAAPPPSLLLLPLFASSPILLLLQASPPVPPPSSLRWSQRF